MASSDQENNGYPFDPQAIPPTTLGSDYLRSPAPGMDMPLYHRMLQQETEPTRLGQSEAFFRQFAVQLQQMQGAAAAPLRKAAQGADTNPELLRRLLENPEMQKAFGADVLGGYANVAAASRGFLPPTKPTNIGQGYNKDLSRFDTDNIIRDYTAGTDFAVASMSEVARNMYTPEGKANQAFLHGWEPGAAAYDMARSLKMQNMTQRRARDVGRDISSPEGMARHIREQTEQHLGIMSDVSNIAGTGGDYEKTAEAFRKVMGSDISQFDTSQLPKVREYFKRLTETAAAVNMDVKGLMSIAGASGAYQRTMAGGTATRPGGPFVTEEGEVPGMPGEGMYLGQHIARRTALRLQQMGLQNDPAAQKFYSQQMNEFYASRRNTTGGRTIEMLNAQIAGGDPSSSTTLQLKKMRDEWMKSGYSGNMSDLAANMSEVLGYDVSSVIRDDMTYQQTMMEAKGRMTSEQRRYFEETSTQDLSRRIGVDYAGDEERARARGMQQYIRRAQQRYGKAAMPTRAEKENADKVAIQGYQEGGAMRADMMKRMRAAGISEDDITRAFDIVDAGGSFRDIQKVLGGEGSKAAEMLSAGLTTATSMTQGDIISGRIGLDKEQYDTLRTELKSYGISLDAGGNIQQGTAEAKAKIKDLIAKTKDPNEKARLERLLARVEKKSTGKGEAFKEGLTNAIDKRGLVQSQGVGEGRKEAEELSRNAGAAAAGGASGSTTKVDGAATPPVDAVKEKEKEKAKEGKKEPNDGTTRGDGADAKGDQTLVLTGTLEFSGNNAMNLDATGQKVFV